MTVDFEKEGAKPVREWADDVDDALPPVSFCSFGIAIIAGIGIVTAFLLQVLIFVSMAAVNEMGAKQQDVSAPLPHSVPAVPPPAPSLNGATLPEKELSR